MLPVGTNVGRAVIEDHVHFPRLQLLPESLTGEERSSVIAVTNLTRLKRAATQTCLHFSVVMSSCRVTTFGMGLIGTRSTPDNKSRASTLDL